jgi:hypothetical protein
MNKQQIGSIQVLFGAEGIKQVYDESIKQKSLGIVCLSKNYEQIIEDYFEKTFVPNVYGKIKTREVLPDTLENRKSQVNKIQSLNAVRFLKNTPESESDILIWENQVILISFRTQSTIVIIISEPELVKSLTAQFDNLWESLS